MYGWDMKLPKDAAAESLFLINVLLALKLSCSLLSPCVSYRKAVAITWTCWWWQLCWVCALSWVCRGSWPQPSSPSPTLTA